jgi:hypothetical protein
MEANESIASKADREETVSTGKNNWNGVCHKPGLNHRGYLNFMRIIENWLIGYLWILHQVQLIVNIFPAIRSGGFSGNG